MSDASGPKKPGDSSGQAESGKASPEAEILKPDAGGKAKGAEASRKRPKVLDGKAEEVKSAGAGAASGSSKAESASAPKETPTDKAKDAASSGSGGNHGGGNGGGGSNRSPKSAAPAGSPGSHLHLISGLLSGIAGAAAVVVIAWHFGIAEPRGDGETAEAANANKQAIADLQDKVGALEAGDSGQTDVQDAVDQALKPIESRLSGLEQEVAALSENTGEGGGVSQDALDKLGQRIDALEKQNADLKDTITEANKAAVAAQNRVGEMQQQMPEAGIDDKVARLDAMIGKLNAELEKLEPQLQQMDQRVAALEKKAEDPDAAKRAALALALANLSRAIEGAGPFQTELRTVSSFLPDEEMPAALEDAAAKGVPTRAALRDRFEPLIDRIFDAERRAGDSTIWDRFAANAASLITVRRTGEISGDSTEAVVARMEEKLKEDDLAGAVAQGDALKGPAAEAAADWMQDAKKRLEADRLVRELTARVTERLSELKG